MTDRLPEHRVIVGMECHVQLKTATKCWCSCAVSFGAEPNTNVCPTCLGLPGAMPVLSKGALEQAIRGGLGLGCTIAAFTKWDRKNYFYPDLPKGFQITQYDKPLCTDGSLVIDGADGPRAIRIQRAHLEEDTGKTTHQPDGAALVDYNRCGTPLLEIVTHPDITSAAEASAYLEELKRVLQYLGVGDCDMEKAQLRCEPNVNVEVKVGEDWVPTRIVELKNLNSFAAVRNSIEYEIGRQVRELLAGGARGPRPKSTRGWDDARRETFLQREKEEAADYRYFPEPDLPPVTTAAARAAEIRKSMPELPRARRERYVAKLHLSPADASVLASTRALGDWYEAVAKAAGDPKLAANWTMTYVLRDGFERFPLSAAAFGAFLKAVAKGDVPREAAKSVVLPEMLATGRADWQAIVDEKGLAPPKADDLEAVVRAVVEEKADIVEKYRAGKLGVKGVLVGEVMKRTKGSADAKRVNETLDRLLAPPTG
jgi:aspartyl-tRNA(Asn)/glutamyl-tRNA(Gln) amidotransferase subunit B